MFPSSRDEAFLADIGISLRNGRVQRGLTIDQVLETISGLLEEDE